MIQKNRGYHEMPSFLEFSEKWSLQAIWSFCAALPGEKKEREREREIVLKEFANLKSRGKGKTERINFHCF